VKALVHHKRGVTIVSFEGHLNFSHIQKLKESLTDLYTTQKNKKVIFNLSKLAFVGSSGIKPFIKVFRAFNKDKKTRPHFTGLSPEYQRLFKAFQGKGKFEIFDDEPTALRSYFLRPRKSARA